MLWPALSDNLFSESILVSLRVAVLDRFYCIKMSSIRYKLACE